MSDPLIFDSWTGLGRILFAGAIAYGALVAMLRVSGKRTLSKMNAFDLIVTVALGSTLATVILNRSVPLAEGVLALALLICLQYAITWTSVRWTPVEGIVKSEPTLLLHGGCFLEDAMRRQRVTRAEILAALRESGLESPGAARSVVLETDGSLSVVPRKDGR
ncbi:DUF421 domain-containing protein [Cereibacter johrii]|uniref:DUF421 domain-containing protein n=1 Tax=Cereibacter johrii TaxID=445629 RepID=UPI000E1DB698|nr:YetF domain-containing protein [Cereibacter johrii]MEA5162786.1 DUF421 domain-containing protein [Cereibacter johrii]RDS96600.1 DUF421 domain-containing protein [Cereibacter sphaeroides f. sp. denitrificans]